MTLIDNKTESEKYAKLYSIESSKTTPKDLAFRDLPKLFNKYHVGNNAMDFSCGVGESTLFLKSQGFKVCGVDINTEMVEIAKKNYPNGEYVNISHTKIPYEDNMYDLVFASFVLVEMSSLEQIQEALNDISRVLKTKGFFIAILCSENLYKYKWKKVNTNFPQNKNLKRGQKVRVEFLDKGFSIEDYYWPQEDYIRVMDNGGLNLLEIHRPLGLESDGINWEDEIFASPISVYTSSKS